MAVKQNITFLSSDKKTTIYGIEWIPEKEPYLGVIQITHGMIEFKERYEETADFLADKGFIVIVCDQLGHGDSVTSVKKRGYFSDKPGCDCLIRDMHQIRIYGQTKYKGLPYILLGHSMGSFLTRTYIEKYGKGLAGVILAGTGWIPSAAAGAGLMLLRFMAVRCGWHYHSSFAEKLIFSSGYEKYDMSGTKPEESWLTRDTEIARAYYANPKSQFKFSLNGFYGLVDAVCYANDPVFMKQIPKNLPILLISGGEDPLGNYGKGTKRVEHMMKRAGVKNVCTAIYTGARHEVLNELNRQQVWEEITDWCKKEVLKISGEKNGVDSK